MSEVQAWGGVYVDEDAEPQTEPQIVVQLPAPVATPVAAAPTTGGLRFEGAKVGRSEIKFTGGGEVEIYDDTTISIDDRVRLVGEFRVVQVRHVVDKKTGDLVRQQFIAPVNALQLVPWDPQDPQDDGIARMRP